MGDAVAEQVLAGHTASGARLIRWLEDADPRGLEALQRIFPKAGRAWIVGITGPPGAGKSTLVDGLIAHWRAKGERVGVLAIDPTSPFSGGAILGDRLRMQRHATDPGVFIRSMATRGQLGGLSRATWEASVVLDAMGFSRVIIETVGVGQDELDVAALADTTAVVCLPGTGDEVQAMKAGIFEVGSCLVLNKADQPGREHALKDLGQLLHLRGADEDGWDAGLVETVATRGQGIAELADALDAHVAHLTRCGALERRRKRAALRILTERVREQAAHQILGQLEQRPELRELLVEVEARRIDPYSAAARLVRAFATGDPT